MRRSCSVCSGFGGFGGLLSSFGPLPSSSGSSSPPPPCPGGLEGKSKFPKLLLASSSSSPLSGLIDDARLVSGDCECNELNVLREGPAVGCGITLLRASTGRVVVVRVVMINNVKRSVNTNILLSRGNVGGSECRRSET